MRVLICADAFKDAADASAVCQAIGRGIHQVCPTARLDLCPLADGGEGTARILSSQLGAQWISTHALDPLNRPVEAGFGWLAASRTALLDMAEASGLQYLAPHERNPLHTSSFGTGQLLQSALEQGAKRLYLGIGGSATNDGGCGMAAALGVRFFADKQLIVHPTGKDLTRITHIDTSDIHPLLAKADLQVLCDVHNPLLGKNGATSIYAPQKGATPNDLPTLEAGLTMLNNWWTTHLGRSLAEVPGSGAAGGLGAGLMAFCGARLIAGADTIFDLLHLTDRLKNSNLVITGEGRLDQQSLSGKLIGQLARRTSKFSVPLIVLCGQLALPSAILSQHGITAAYTITPPRTPLTQALRDTTSNLTHSAARVSRHFLSS